MTKPQPSLYRPGAYPPARRLTMQSPRTFRSSCPALHLVLAEHGPPAFLRAAIAIRIIVIAVEQVVLVGQFFPSGNVADRKDKHPPIHVVRFAVRVTGVIDKHGDPKPVDHRLVDSTAEQVGNIPPLISFIRLIFAEARSVVLADPFALFDRPCRITARCMNRRRTNDQPINHSQVRPIQIKMPAGKQPGSADYNKPPSGGVKPQDEYP